jgi:hypothetical protein
MSILSSLQDPILPIFMVMLVGYFMRCINFFDVPSAHGFNNFFLYGHAGLGISGHRDRSFQIIVTGDFIKA